MCCGFHYDVVWCVYIYIYIYIYILSALKKEMEQIERGELDGELVSMWEKAQA